MSAWHTSPLVVGHRGGRGPGWPPENTLAAFDRARVEGARAVELDVRTSSDGHSVVVHDATLSRVTSGRDVRRVDSVGLAELRAIDLGATSGALPARIPLLAEALDWSRDHGVAVNVELKYDVRRLDDVARAAVRAVRDARADVLFSSFDPRLLAWVAALAPVWPRALITHSRQSPFLRGARELLRGPVVRFVGAIHLEEAEATTHVVDDLRRRGLRVGVWTVNDPSAAVRFARGGVGSIITDSPGAILEGLESVRARARAMG